MNRRILHSNRICAGSTADLSRRAFLAAACLTALPMSSAGGADPDGPPPDSSGQLPRISLGRYSLSRLICGANPFNAGSHLSTFVNQDMRAYYTPQQIIKTLRRCQQVGINCWQGSGSGYLLHRQLRDEGGQMHYISLGENHYGGAPALSDLARAGCIAVAHHGEVTDHYFKNGQLDRVRDYLKQVHDAGLMAGVSTHMPAVVDAVESKDWEVDFYMTCVYERHRSEQELKKLLGDVPLPVGEVYLQSDPPRMFRAIRQTRRPCLAFKILAAGRLAERKDWIERAFRDTFRGIKQTDGLIVGIFDKYADQPAEDAELTRRFGANASGAA